MVTMPTSAPLKAPSLLSSRHTRPLSVAAVTVAVAGVDTSGVVTPL